MLGLFKGMARPRTFDRNEALERAVALFQVHGFEHTKVPDIVESLGICRQSLYNEFGDKRGLYLAVLERYGQREIDNKLALLQSPGSPLQNLLTVIRGWAALASQCPADGCLTAAALVEHRDDAGVLAVVEAQVDRLEAGFAQALRAAQAAGELRASVDPQRIARSLTNSCYGLGLLSRLPGSAARIGDSVAAMIAMIDAAAVSGSER